MLAGPYGLHCRGLRPGERMRVNMRRRKSACRGELEEWPGVGGHRRRGNTERLSTRRLVKRQRLLCLDELISCRCQSRVRTRGIGAGAQLLLYQDMDGLREDL